MGCLQFRQHSKPIGEMGMEHNCRQEMKRIKDRNNFKVNLHFLMESNKKNQIKVDDNLLRQLAFRFSLWEENNVFTLENRYETFRENFVWLDYDEILEMYLIAVVHPNQKESYWDDDCYKYFRENLFEQINKVVVQT